MLPSPQALSLPSGLPDRIQHQLYICRSYSAYADQTQRQECSVLPGKALHLLSFSVERNHGVSQITVQLEREKDGVHLKAEVDPGITLTIDRSLLDGEG